MKTKDVLLVLGGVALGYLAFKMNFGKRTATAIGDVATGVKDTATGIVADVKDVAVNVDTTVKCEKKWSDEVGSISRFASQEAMEKSKSDYIKTCVASL
jgi:hypothetical protein